MWIAGPKSRQAVDLVKGLVCAKGTFGKWHALRGNHESMMMAWAAGEDQDKVWGDNGGGATIESYRGFEDQRTKHLRWFGTLPTLIQFENHAFVHAGCSPRYALDEQPEEVLLWIRGWE